MKEIAAAASVYNIPVNPENSHRGGMDNAIEAAEMSQLDISRLEINARLNVIPGTAAAAAPSESIPFPSYDEIDVVHGQGTVALELEQEMTTGVPITSSRRIGYKSRPDIVIGDIDSGITLSGICMAFVGTGTHVFGAAPTHGFWDHAWNTNSEGSSATMQDGSQGQRYWAGTRHPMSAIP